MRRTIHMREVRTLNGLQYQSLHGLGALTISPALATSISNATSVINSANAAIPGQTVQIQTKFSKVANTIAGIAGAVAAVAAVVPGIGTVVAVVAGIVAAVCAILGKIFARAKSKELDAQRAQWDAANAKLREENAELDLKYENLKANMATLRTELSRVTGIDFKSGKDNSVKGLGLCIFNCKKKAAEQNLNTSKQQNESLTKAQNEKIALCEELIKEWETLTQAVIDLKKKGNTNAGLIIAIGAVALIGGFAILRD